VVKLNNSTSATPVIQIQDLRFSYPDGQPALQGITFSAMPGEKIALVGPNGAGKSTLILHLNGILSGEGLLEICGRQLDHKNLSQVRARVGLVFQSPDDQLFSPTVFEDVAYGPIYQGLSPAEVQSRVEAALAAVHMEPYIHRNSHHLSIGEKKRIAIATVLSMEPEILVLDEPSAGLDPRARRQLIELLQELPQTMIIATHDLALVRDILPRTLLLDQGRVVADGPTDVILSNSALVAEHGLA